MKKYEFVRMRKKAFGEYYAYEGNTDRTHRDVINEMAAKGWRFVDNIPVDLDGYGKLRYYDLVFEKEIDQQKKVTFVTTESDILPF